MSLSRTRRRLLGIGAGVTALVATALVGANAANAEYRASSSDEPVSVRILSPRDGDHAGTAGKGWIVNLSVRYPGGGAEGLKAAGTSGLQLTGPAAHNDTAPFPGTFTPGQDDRLPGLVVLASSTTAFSGPGTNLANLFNTTGIADRTEDSTEILDNWIVGAPAFGQNTTSTLTAAVIKDLDKNGVYDDAPATVPDANGDGRIDAKDVSALGTASDVETVTFRINGAS